MIALLLLTAAASAGPDALMLGNSYTASNDLHVLVSDLFAASNQTPNVQALVSGGLTLADHAEKTEQKGSAWHDALVSGKSDWTWVVLQDQSQIPGFPETESYWQSSLAGAQTLDGLAAERGARTMFLMTWGRRDGDSQNPSLYPDFLTMQDRLEEGYIAYAEQTSSADRTAWIAPAGLAFEQVYLDLQAEGQDPLASGSLFDQLYSGDGSHPALAGSYLTACVVFAAMSGATPQGLPGPSGLEAETITALQDAAYEAVFVANTHIAYPWDEEGAGDSGGEAEEPEPSGDTESEDTAGDDEIGSTPAPEIPEDTSTTRSCSSVGGVGGAWLIAALGLGWRRR